MNKFFDALFKLRYLAIFAVIAPFFGAILMLLFGTRNTVEAYLVYFEIMEPEGAIESGEAAMIKLVASVDHFLFAAILMIFAVGLYALFFKSSSRNEDGSKKVPSWKHLKSMGGMDEMLLKVIIMLLAVSFLEVTLVSGIGTLNWTALVVPAAVIAFALALKWMSAMEANEAKEELSESKAAKRIEYLDTLERLAALREKAVITDEEFESVKKGLSV